MLSAACLVNAFWEGRVGDRPAFLFRGKREVWLPIVVGELRAGFAVGNQGPRNEAVLRRFLLKSGVDVLYADEQTTHHYANVFSSSPKTFTTVVRTLVRGAASYQPPWFDANLGAYAECYGLPELISEDFEDARLYAAVRAKNPFLCATGQ